MFPAQFLATIIAQCHGAKNANFMTLPKHPSSAVRGGLSSDTLEGYFKAVAAGQEQRKRRNGK